MQKKETIKFLTLLKGPEKKNHIFPGEKIEFTSFSMGLNHKLTHNFQGKNKGGGEVLKFLRSERGPKEIL